MGGGQCAECQKKKISAGGRPLQTKLAVSEPSDVYEQEADRVAEQVMRMADDISSTSTGTSGVSLRQRYRGVSIASMPVLQRTEADEKIPVTEGERPKEEGSRCPSWRGDPQSISKRAAEFYARNHLTPPSQATVERVQCDPPIANGNYGCYVYFSDGLVLRVIVRETDIVVGTGPGPITTEHPPPATPLCFYEYSCPDGDLVLTVKKCRSAKASGSSGPPAVAQRATVSGALPPRAAPSSVHAVLNSSGQPLDSATRAYFEPRFGCDFSQVRVHSDGAAQQSAREVNAHAYTVGHNIVFGAGRFSPETKDGRHLLAHELTHVLQQRRDGAASSTQAESETHNVAGRMSHGYAVSTKNLSGAPHGIYCDSDDDKKPKDTEASSKPPPMPNLQLQTLPPIDWLKMRRSFDLHGERLSLRDADDMVREWERSSAILDTLGIDDRFKLWFITKKWILNKGLSMQLDDRFARTSPNSWDRFNRDWKNANPGAWQTPIFPIFDSDWFRSARKKK